MCVRVHVRVCVCVMHPGVCQCKCVYVLSFIDYCFSAQYVAKPYSTIDE